jgi:7-cyano-7-deazaguanine synthase
MVQVSKAVVLLSGGLDSATTLAEARAQGFSTYALTVDYGQRHSVERVAAQRVARSLNALKHIELSVDLRSFGGSALTSDIYVPKDRPIGEISTGIPVTYVPARNTVMLSLALAWAESLGAYDIFTGVNCVDYSGYPDCRPEYLEAFVSLANLATRDGVEGKGRFRVHAPLLKLTKEQIIQRGFALGVDYALTHTCYDPKEDGASCGRCDACALRLSAFANLGISDPIRYQSRTK